MIDIQKTRYVSGAPCGSLFYPGCGDDTFEPIMQFIDTITEFHFVGISRIARLLKLECCLIITGSN